MLYNIQTDNKKIKEILFNESYVSDDDLTKAEKTIAKTHATLSEYLISEGLITKDLLGQAIAEYYNVEYADLNSSAPAQEMMLKVSEEIAKKYRVILFSEGDNIGKKNAKNITEITITTDDPSQKDLIKNLQPTFVGKKIHLAYSLSEDIDEILMRYRRALVSRLSKILAEDTRVAPQIFEEILKEALSCHASDIHLEPQDKDVLVRFRVDGVLSEAGRVPKQYYDNILNRIKIQANLRIDEHFAAQDGSIRYADFDNNKNVDLRISLVPTLEGEKVVARLLSQYVQGFALADLGFSEEHQEILIKTSKKPFGMIVVAGPTGSGKTTTLYALLKHINKPEINVTTIEDPVEYKISGINQIQVNPKTSLTFAQGLKSIVRQDPDIILVGEIRDRETVEIAVNAALTGHLMLSTFHANDAATAIPRLLDMGVEPFLLSSTLELVISQRLVRKICEHCRYSYKIDSVKKGETIRGIEEYFKNCTTWYQGKGCDICSFTGYKGRVAIFESIRATPEMRELMLKRPSTGEIWRLARSQGARSLFEDGVEKVLNGVSTLEELLRVAEPPITNTDYAKSARAKKK